MKLSAASVSSPLDTPRVPSVAMSVYIATMTHTAVTFSIVFQDWLAGRVAGLGLGRDAMMPGVRPNATSRPGRPHSQRGIMDERGQPLPCEGLASVETGEKVAFASDAQMKQNTRCVSNDEIPALFMTSPW